MLFFMQITHTRAEEYLFSRLATAAQLQTNIQDFKF